MIPRRVRRQGLRGQGDGLEDTPVLRQIIRYVAGETAQGIVITIEQSNVDTQERADHSMKNWLSALEGLKKLVPSGFQP